MQVLKGRGTRVPVFYLCFCFLPPASTPTFNEMEGEEHSELDVEVA